MIAVEFFCLLSLLLVAGKFLRVGIPLLRKLYLLGVVFAVSALFAAEPDPPVIERSKPRTYHIRSVVKASFLGNRPEELNIITALPESSQYQTVSGETVSNGHLRRFPLDCGRYAFYSARKKFPPLVLEFDVTIYDVRTRWDRIKNIPEPSGEQSYFTKTSGIGIRNDYPPVVKVSRELAARSKNIVEYARLAYLYMTEKFKYGRAPDISLHSIWRCRRGNCGNLSSVYVSLLRTRGIPARSVLALRPDGSGHVWAEFFVDGVGWIPVDVTADLGKGNFRHFGNIYGDSCVVLHKDLYFNVFNGRKDVEIEALQTYAFWFWSKRRIGKVKTDMSFKGNLVPDPKAR